MSSIRGYEQHLGVWAASRGMSASRVWAAFGGMSSIRGLGDGVQCPGRARGMFSILLKNRVSYQRNGNMVVAKRFCRTENMRNWTRSGCHLCGGASNSDCIGTSQKYLCRKNPRRTQGDPEKHMRHPGEFSGGSGGLGGELRSPS